MQQEEHIQTFMKFYADYLRCIQDGIYKPKEGFQILAEECHYLYGRIQREQTKK